MDTYSIAPHETDRRLDAALAFFLPNLGLRARRRLCQHGMALVNGKPQHAAYKVKNGDILSCTSQSLPPTAGFALPDAMDAKEAMFQPRAVCIQPPFAAVYKPAGLHTAHITGSPEASLEKMLPDLLPLYPQARLLNRLDKKTGGLVMLALQPEGEKIWHTASIQGKISKTYQFIAQHTIPSDHLPLPCTFTVRHALDTQNTSVTRVSGCDEASPLRHTHFTVLGRIPQEQACALLNTPPNASPNASPGVPQENMPPALFFVQAEILLGARHQIRVHAASAGFPLWGDTLYGGCPAPGDVFFLHHIKLQMPGFLAECPAPWGKSLTP